MLLVIIQEMSQQSSLVITGNGGEKGAEAGARDGMEREQAGEGKGSER